MDRLASRHVVLLGIGHTNAHLVRMWKMNPIADADLTCVSNFSLATYSGMLPAVLAGQKAPHEMQIDLVRLCASAGARLITNPVSGIDQVSNELLFQDRPAVAFDVLSIGVGSIANQDKIEIDGDSVVEIKPMQTFLPRLQQKLKQVMGRSKTLNVVIVGGGVAGVEISCCVRGFLQQNAQRDFSITLVTRGDQILPEVVSSLRRRVKRQLHARGISIATGAGVTRVTNQAVELATGVRVEADLVIWATGATGPPLLTHLGLELESRGFIKTDQTLRVVSTSNIFAVGDTGTMIGEQIPKAGVYAVRQGPVLWENVQRQLSGRPLKRYRPQHSFLKLLNLGDGTAAGQWKSFSFSGRWALQLKDRIDSGFMEKYQVQSMESDAAEMQCRGCGCKLGTESLNAGLGLVAAEDAACVGGDGSGLVASTDFFSAPLDDPFLAGRIAAIHAASDIIASGAVPTEALANVVLPEGDAQSQERTLRDFMAGAKREFDLFGGRIVGGHTIVGPRMEAGFTVIGKTLGSQPIRKNKLKVGDRLFLTKPLGIGVLLAAHMRSQCRAAWYEQLIFTMLQPQIAWAHIASEIGITAGTDVTGFGLAGHLVEMLTSSRVGAELTLDRIPILDGVSESIAAGIESSLAPANFSVASHIVCPAMDSGNSRYRALFDPQTCGGLLFGVAADRCARFEQAARTVRMPVPVEIGRVISLEPGSKCLRLL